MLAVTHHHEGLLDVTPCITKGRQYAVPPPPPPLFFLFGFPFFLSGTPCTLQWAVLGFPPWVFVLPSRQQIAAWVPFRAADFTADGPCHISHPTVSGTGLSLRLAAVMTVLGGTVVCPLSACKQVPAGASAGHRGAEGRWPA